MKFYSLLLMIKILLSTELASCETASNTNTAAPLGAKQEKQIRVDPQARVLRDIHGRHVILHGVNVVYKVPPYIPDQDHFDS